MRFRRAALAAAAGWIAATASLSTTPSWETGFAFEASLSSAAARGRHHGHHRYNPVEDNRVNEPNSGGGGGGTSNSSAAASSNSSSAAAASTNSASTTSSSNSTSSSNTTSSNSSQNGGTGAAAVTDTDDPNARKQQQQQRPYGRRDEGPLAVQGGSQQPPRTVAEGLTRFFNSLKQHQPDDAKERGHGHRHPHKPETKTAEQPATQTQTPKAATPATRTSLPETTLASAPAGTLQTGATPKPRQTGISNYTGDIGALSHSPYEVLGVGVTNETKQAARALGYGVFGDASVTRFIVPEGVDATTGQATLQKAFPKAKFGLNHYYRVYKAADDSIDGAARSVAPAGDATSACTGDRCMGQRLLKWQDERELRSCSKGLPVGVMDTGVDFEHPALRTINIGHFGPEGRTEAPTWHGTGVLTLLAGDPKSGTPGLIPDAKFFVASVFYADRKGNFASDTETLLHALDWMEKMGVKVVNMSFAGPRDSLVEQRIAAMSAKGFVFVAAAGNNGPDAEPSYPAAYKQVIAVTAVDKSQRVYAFANRGKHIDVAAPGVDIWTAVPKAREGYYTGTSFAAPFVTAVVATLYRNTAAKTKDALLLGMQFEDLGRAGRDTIYGQGLVIAPSGCAPQSHIASALPDAAGGATAAPWSTKVDSTSLTRGNTVSAGFR